MGGIEHAVFEPGVFADSAVHTAAAVGLVVAVVSGIVGTFTVLRGQSFAGHALADMSSTGGSAAFLLGISPLLGFVGIGVVAAGVMEAIGVQRQRGRDLATGIVLGAGLGLAALFLYLDTTFADTTGTTVSVLFGSMFTITSSTVPVVVGFGLVALAIVAVAYRPLLLSSIHPDLASVRGVPVRLVGVAYLVALALAVALSAMTIGAILSTALLIGPAATALRITRRPGRAVLGAMGCGLAATWIGILLAYDSYYWSSSHRSWPVSFFVVALVFVFYLAADQLSALGRRGRARAQSGAARSAGPAVAAEV